MLRPVTTSSAAASAAPTAVQASAAATLSVQESGATTVSAPVSQNAEAASQAAKHIFRYNSFEFIYRQDVGRIVLIGQSPETGERVVQVPSEHALRIYEHTARIEKQMAQQASQPTLQQSSVAAPELSKALMAAVGGDNHGSGMISVSA